MCLEQRRNNTSSTSFCLCGSVHHSPLVCEQVILSIELSHGDRLGVQDVCQHGLVHPAADRGLPLQGSYCIAEYLIALTHNTSNIQL